MNKNKHLIIQYLIIGIIGYYTLYIHTNWQTCVAIFAIQWSTNIENRVKKNIELYHPSLSDIKLY